MAKELFGPASDASPQECDVFRRLMRKRFFSFLEEAVPRREALNFDTDGMLAGFSHTASADALPSRNYDPDRFEAPPADNLSQTDGRNPADTEGPSAVPTASAYAASVTSSDKTTEAPRHGLSNVIKFGRHDHAAPASAFFPK